jgi:hypothetical protein
MGIVAQARARLRWPQQQQVPLDGAYEVYRDARDGNVDYADPVNPAPIPAWPDEEGKIGDGLGRDGQGADGFGDGGSGDGLGADCLGPDGFGANWQEYVTPELADGTWELAVVPVDAAGNETTPATLEESVALAGIPEPPTNIQPTDYDGPSDTLTISWTLSEAAEG